MLSTRRAFAGLCVCLAATACRSVAITPRELARDPNPDAARALELWRESIERANAFLASPYRRTLPAGRYELRDGGLCFLAGGGELAVNVRATTWGDWVVRTGFQAQEREDGFVVGAEPPDADPLVDHSLFRDGDGALRDADSMAATTLHETAHAVFREGTIGVWNSLAYYLEAIFLFRYASHSDERHAQATSEEYAYFALEREAPPEYKAVYRESFETHVSKPGGKRCRHEPPPGPLAPGGD